MIIYREKPMTQLILLCLLTLFGSAIGTATGFGTSTVMIPVMVLFAPPHIALLFVGVFLGLVGAKLLVWP